MSRRTPERIDATGQIEKQCGKCGEWWLLTEEFWGQEGGALRSPCKACRQEMEYQPTDEPCCVPGCTHPRYVSSRGWVASRCEFHLKRQARRNYLKRRLESCV